ncbi:MAG: aldo/keto reductase [Micrococcales bacterium]|nr:aldo/keto reductase [Micrococcales bacterium]
MANAAKVPLITLNNGVTIPQLGFGTYKIDPDQTERAVTQALELGYRHVDTAKLYYNEAPVGRAVKNSGLDRSEVFVTTKLWNDQHGDAATAFNQSLDRLGLDYVDLYLIHWPAPAQGLYIQAWRTMEQIVASGMARAIGVCNFLGQQLGRLIDQTDTIPAVNQIELHPNLQQRQAAEFSRRHGTIVEAWGPLGHGKGLILDHPVVKSLAAATGQTPAQVLLRWQIQQGNIVIPKTVHPQRMTENLDVFDFELTTDQMAALTALEDGTRLGPDPETFG